MWSLLLMVLFQPPVAVVGQIPVKATDLMPPVALRADGKFIDVEVGHAAPFVADLNAKPHLLVGQFGGGKLRLYPIAKNGTEPRLGKFEWFQAGGQTGSVPAG